jgi:pimeloyl-ACP methyl ester carboxylesterase
MAELVPFAVSLAGAEIRGMRGGEGPTALLLHGTTGSWRNFRPWLPALLPRTHLLIPDLPGFGASPAPSARPRLRTWARLLRMLVAELETPPRILVGLGLGASVAMSYLEAAPPGAPLPPLTHLILHTPAYYPGALRPAARWSVRLVGAAPTFAVARHILAHSRFQAWYLRRLVEGPDVSSEDARILREDFQRTSIPVLRGLLVDLVRADFRPLLRTQTVPALIIAAENDPFVYASEMRRLASLMPRARLAMQSALGHGWTAESVAEQRRWLADFLDAAPP